MTVPNRDGIGGGTLLGMPAPRAHRNTAASADESALLADLLAGDAAATERFVRETTPRALAVARRIVANEADLNDAVQEAYAAFFRALPGFQGASRLTTWLHRIVVNAALMRRRSAGRQREVSIDALLPQFYEDGHRVDPRPAPQRSADELVANDELRTRVREFIERLPDEYREVIWLRDIEELDTATTAALLGDTPGAIKTRLHRARQALRTLLENELPDVVQP